MFKVFKGSELYECQGIVYAYTIYLIQVTLLVFVTVLILLW